MEGHLAAPTHRLEVNRVGSMPEPPFPDPDDPRFDAVVTEAEERFSGGEEPAALAFAAALGWQAGRKAGAECPGCAPEGHDDPVSIALRSGTMEVRFHMPGQQEAR
jgi:hypothetical protein